MTTSRTFGSGQPSQASGGDNWILPDWARVACALICVNNIIVGNLNMFRISLMMR